MQTPYACLCVNAGFAAGNANTRLDQPTIRSENITSSCARTMSQFFPALDARRILFTPFFLEDKEIRQGFLLGDCLVNELKIRHQRLDILVTDVAGGADE